MYQLKFLSNSNPTLDVKREMDLSVLKACILSLWLIELGRLVLKWANDNQELFTDQNYPIDPITNEMDETQAHEIE